MMQTDVKSYHASASGVATTNLVRLKNVLVTTGTVSARNMAVADPTVSKSGTWSRTGTLVTVTINNNGLTNGQRVFLDVAAGTTMRDGVYEVSNVATNTFTVTVGSATTNGNVTMYAVVLAEFDSSNATSFYTLIPGEGILAEEGIYVGLPADVTTTLFYG